MEIFASARAGQADHLGAGGVVKVDADFEDEFPDGDRTCTEAHASLVRTGDALLVELERRIARTFGVKQTVATALAVLDGRASP